MSEENMDKVHHEGTENSFDNGWGTNTPTLLELKESLESSRTSHQDQSTQINTWLDLLHVKSGSKNTGSSNAEPFSLSSKKKVADGKSKISPKLIRKQAEWRYTSLSEPFLSTPDIFNVDPVTHEDKESAIQNGLLLNNQFNTRIDKVNFIDSLVRNLVNEGTAIVRVGWEYESQMGKKKYPIYVYEETQDPKHLEELEAMMQDDPSVLPEEFLEALNIYSDTGLPHWPIEDGFDEVEEEEVLKNHPSATLCHFDNVTIDPSAGNDIDKADFIIYSFEGSTSDLEKKGIYKNLDKLDIFTGSVLADPDHTSPSNYAETGFEHKDKPRKKHVIYEYWGNWDIDGSGTTKPIVATWVGDVMIRLEENPFPDGKAPFVIIPYLPVKESVYGEPDAELLEDNQQILGAVTRGMIDVMGRSANGQTGIRQDALDVVNRRKFDKGLDYEFNASIASPDQAIFMHTYAEIPQSAYQMVLQQNQEAESLTGIKAFSQGVTGAGLGDTATSARGALDAAARRELGILRRLGEGLKRVARKFISMNQEFMSEEEVIRVTNQRFVRVRRDDLAGNFDLRISISTAEADEQKANELSFMLQTTGQEFGLEFSKIILSEIATLRKMPVLAERLANFEPTPDPVAEQVAQLEVEKLQLENQKIQAEIAKINAEAGDKSASTDRQNLDFVEQESGVNHERAMEKDGAQARANAELEILKKTLEPTKDASEI